MDGWMDKQNVAHTHNWILFSLKEDASSAVFHNMDDSWGYYAKWSKPVIDKYGMILLTWGI